jgi:hypothetical protein
MKKLLSFIAKSLLFSATAVASVFPVQALQIAIKPSDGDIPGSLPTTTVRQGIGEIFGQAGNMPLVTTQVNTPLIPLLLNVWYENGIVPQNNHVNLNIQTGAQPLGLMLGIAGVYQDWYKLESYQLGNGNAKTLLGSTLVRSNTINELPQFQVPYDTSTGMEVWLSDTVLGMLYAVVTIRW